MPSPKSLVKTILFTAAIALGVSACSWSGGEKTVTYTPDKTYNLTILYTSGFPDDSPASHTQAIRNAKATLIRSIRDDLKNSNHHLILLSGGAESPDSPTALGTHLDKLDYDALVVNSYMFNQPLSYIRELEKNSSTPFISANLFESETGQPLFDAFTLISADDLNIAVVGVTSNEFMEKHRKHLSGLDIISSPSSKSTDFIKKLKRQSDIVIAVTHSGHLPGAGIQEHIASYPGLDLVVGEHQEETLLSTRNCNEWVTRIDLEFINGQIEVTRQEKLILLDQKVPALSI